MAWDLKKNTQWDISKMMVSPSSFSFQLEKVLLEETETVKKEVQFSSLSFFNHLPYIRFC